MNITFCHINLWEKVTTTRTHTAITVANKCVASWTPFGVSYRFWAADHKNHLKINISHIICWNILVKPSLPQCIQLVDNLLYRYRNMKCKTSLKIHFLHSHVDPPPISDKHSFSSILPKWINTMLAHYWWTVKQDAPDTHNANKQKNKNQKHHMKWIKWKTKAKSF